MLHCKVRQLSIYIGCGYGWCGMPGIGVCVCMCVLPVLCKRSCMSAILNGMCRFFASESLQSLQRLLWSRKRKEESNSGFAHLATCQWALQRCSLTPLTVLLLMKTLEKYRYGSSKPMITSRQSF